MANSIRLLDQPRRLTPSRYKIDWSDPLTNGLMAAYLPGVSQGVNLTGTGSDLVFGSAPLTHVPFQEGPAAKFSQANSGLTGPAQSSILLPPQSLYWRGVQLGSGSSSVNYIGIDFAAAGTSPFVIANITETSGLVTVYWNNNGTQHTLGALGTPTVNTVASLAASLEGAGGTSYLYRNGSLSTSTAYGATNATSGTSPQISIGTLSGFPTRFPNCATFCGFIWNRSLSADEHRQLDTDPYRFLISPERHYAYGDPTGATIIEAISLADTVTTTQTLLAAVSESLAFLDAPSSGKATLATIAESIHLADLTNAEFNKIAEAIALLDSVSVAKNLSATIAETIALLDRLDARGPIAASLSETMSLLDSQSLLRDAAGTVLEAMTMLDTQSISGKAEWPTYLSYDRYGNKVRRPLHNKSGNPLRG